MHQDAPANVKAAFNRRAILQCLPFLAALLLSMPGRLQAAESTAVREVDRETVSKWSAPYRGWHYRPDHVIPPEPNIPGYDAQFASDPKVFRDGDHWVMLYFGVGKDGAHVMFAGSRDLLHWSAHPEPLYKAGGNPSGLDKQYAHKISLVYNPKNETFYMFYCACGNKGRGIGVITSKPLPR